jgi:hypothetical protein
MTRRTRLKSGLICETRMVSFRDTEQIKRWPPSDPRVPAGTRKKMATRATKLSVASFWPGSTVQFKPYLNPVVHDSIGRKHQCRIRDGNVIDFRSDTAHAHLDGFRRGGAHSSA